jgi:hypothetical protein
MIMNKFYEKLSDGLFMHFPSLQFDDADLIYDILIDKIIIVDDASTIISFCYYEPDDYMFFK